MKLASMLIILMLASPVASMDARLTASPRIALNSGVRIEAYVPRNPANRRLRIEVDGPVFRAFEEQMEGERARALFSLTMAGKMDDGEYEVRLAVERSNGSVFRLSTSFCRGQGCVTSDIAP